jgi:NAD(P)-dependent dehydrogenase (short-subunit alcohol dehydrogenase family)
MQLLEGKAVLMTGAAGGIGSASAIVFAKAGARLILSDVNADGGHQVLEEVRSLGATAEFVAADLSSESGVRQLIDRAVAVYGRLDCAFNNAGTEQHGKPLHELTTSEWEKTIRIDLTLVFWSLKYEIGAMLQSGGGSIVNTASGLGQIAIPNAAEYVAAKHGVIGLTRAAAVEYAARGIRTNCLLPGVVRTPMITRLTADQKVAAFMAYLKGRHPIGRFGEPNEIGEAAKWLLSESASFVNGAAMPVDGGFLAG